MLSRYSVLVVLAEYFICIICKTDYYYLTRLLMDEKEIMKAQFMIFLMR